MFIQDSFGQDKLDLLKKTISLSPFVSTTNVATLLWPSVGVKPNTWKK
jgi:hypothetical protein